MVDPVEEFLQVKVHDVAVAVRDVSLRLGDGVMGRAAGAKPVAVLGERRVPTPLQDLLYRLLDEAVERAGNAELPDTPSVALRDFHPLHRLGLVRPAQELFPNGRPVFAQVAGEFLDGHPVDARAALVGPDAP